MALPRIEPIKPVLGAFNDLPNIREETHPIQCELIRFLGEQAPQNYYGQNDLLKLAREAAEERSGQGHGLGMEALEHLSGIGVMEQRVINGEKGPHWRLSDKGRLVYSKLVAPPKATLRAAAEATLSQGPKTVTPKTEAPQEPPMDLTVEQCSSLGFSDLRRALKARGLSGWGSKSDLYDRLCQSIQTPAKAPGRTLG